MPPSGSTYIAAPIADRSKSVDGATTLIQLQRQLALIGIDTIKEVARVADTLSQLVGYAQPPAVIQVVATPGEGVFDEIERRMCTVLKSVLTERDYSRVNELQTRCESLENRLAALQGNDPTASLGSLVENAWREKVGAYVDQHLEKYPDLIALLRGAEAKQPLAPKVSNPPSQADPSSKSNPGSVESKPGSNTKK